MNTQDKSPVFFIRLVAVAGAMALLIYLFGLWQDNRDLTQVNPAYQEYIDRYNALIRENLEKFETQEEKEGETGIMLREGVTLNNFEGPQIRLHALEFWGQEKGRGSQGVIEYGENYLLFDPDHPKLGMPDIEVNVSPLKLYSPGEEKLFRELGAFFSSTRRGNHPAPYKVYTKRIIPHPGDTINRPMEVQMQLWLTEFKVTIGARPERKWRDRDKLTDAEKDNKIYPGFWYGLGERLAAGDLKKEDDNNRYGDLKIWLRLIPNNAPWYVNNAIGQNTKPEVGIGAVYCMGLAKEPEEAPNLIMSSVIKGKEMALYSRPAYAESAEGTDALKTVNFEPCAGSSVSRNVSNSCTFWNKEYYVKIFLKNFGSYREGLLGSRRYDDQITYHFLMPILVEGSWDVIPPSEIIPNWDPPEPYFRRGISIIPRWGMKGVVGKLLSVGLIALAVVGFFVLFLPVLFNSFLSGFTGFFRRK